MGNRSIRLIILGLAMQLVPIIVGEMFLFNIVAGTVLVSIGIIDFIKQHRKEAKIFKKEHLIPKNNVEVFKYTLLGIGLGFGLFFLQYLIYLFIYGIDIPIL